MLAAAGDRLTDQGVRIQGFAREWCVEHGVGGHQRRHAGCGGAAHARAQRNALFDLDFETERHAEGVAQ